MTKIDIFSGFLGAGKTTLIKKLIKEAYAGEKLVLIENEFGEIGVDGGFLADAGINVTEMNSGCICCSLVGDFSKALVKVLHEYHPDRILIEPSGVGKLSDVVRAVKGVQGELEISSLVTVVDAGKCKMYMKNFGEFFGDQIANAGAIVLSHTGKLSGERVDAAVALCRAQNADAVIVTTDWDALTGEQLRDAIEHRDTLEAAKEELEHAHHHHEHDEHCECGCHHDHDEHHHHHDEHKHEHHHHHHADEVFVSYGAETAKTYTVEGLNAALAALANPMYGTVLRAKGIVKGEDAWLHFDYVPGEPDVRTGSAGIIGRLCVIGADLDREALSALFGAELK